MTHDEAMFYADLDRVADFVDVPDPNFYRPAPDSWWVIITDVEGSTKAIEAGRYKEVNALGVASIVALQNACEGVDIPFVFGGDGATLLCPSSCMDAVREALRGVKKRAREGFELSMRAGLVPISKLREAGHPVLIARYQASTHICLAMLAGSGVAEAENWVKDKSRQGEFEVRGEATTEASFEGFECRWAPVGNRHGLILSLLVQALGGTAATRAEVYRRVIKSIDAITTDHGRPVAPSNMKLAQASNALDTEITIRTGERSGLRFTIARRAIQVQTSIGRGAMEKGTTRFGFDGKRYLEETIANTDFRKFDETLRMVIDVSAEQRAQIEKMLNDEMSAGSLLYGAHESDAALITCKVKDREGQHVHFVDGSDGGYALAAKTLKQRLKAR